MKQKKSVEDYLKTIYILSGKKEVHGADIAGELKVSRPTVSVALKALAEEGYVVVDDIHEVHLTEKGRQIAEETYERHNTFRRLLTGLGVDEKTASEDACEMEHAVSARSYEALKTLTAVTDGGKSGRGVKPYDD
ncbi:MAG: metal-dependent transcriptional regulator [Lachnospiraceae bacterium]|nr:metal-dependent transcriptional regulator [Lachnospiraceae bacterium]MDE7332082.1 metal-dependent transcriptional regulator [Lachnospiraceae bacterium]